MARESDVIARLTVLGVGLMNEEERKDVARWLRGLASRIQQEGEQFVDGRFTARLHGPHNKE